MTSGRPRSAWLPKSVFLSPQIRDMVPALLICLVLAVGTVAVFPMMDDAWLGLLRTETPAQAVPPTIPERPLYGILLGAAATSMKGLLWIGTITNFFIWAIAAYQGAAFWRLWFPWSSRYAAIAACFAVAPIVVQTQLTTLTTTVPVNLPVLGAYAACLLLIPFAQTGRRPAFSLTISGILLFTAGVISEYAFVCGIATAVIVAWYAGPAHPSPVRRRAVESIGLIGFSMLASTVVFRLTVIDARPDFVGVSVVPAFRQILGDLGHYAALVPSSLAYVSVGAYGAAAGRIWISSLDRPALAALLFGAVVAGALLWACQRPEMKAERTVAFSSPPLPAWLLAAATVTSLLPAVLIGMFQVGRDAHWEEFSTRCFATALPFAAVGTTALLTQFLVRRYWYIPALAAGCLAGDATVLHIVSTYRHQQSIAAMGDALSPYMTNSAGYTIAIVPDYYGRDAEMTFKASQTWPIEARKRLWILWEGRMPVVLRSRANRTRKECREINNIDRNLRMVVRKGPIAQLLWLEPGRNGTFTAEPYCTGL